MNPSRGWYTTSCPVVCKHARGRGLITTWSIHVRHCTGQTALAKPFISLWVESYIVSFSNNISSTGWSFLAWLISEQLFRSWLTLRSWVVHVLYPASKLASGVPTHLPARDGSHVHTRKHMGCRHIDLATSSSLVIPWLSTVSIISRNSLPVGLYTVRTGSSSNWFFPHVINDSSPVLSANVLLCRQ